MDYFNAFWVGGLICALVQILLDKTKLLPGRVMVLLVCSGICRRRCQCSTSWIWKYSVERHEKSDR